MIKIFIMTIMKTESNVTQNRQNKDLEAPFSPREFLKIKRVCKIFLLWKRNLYIRSLVSCVTKLVGVYSFRNDNGENKKFDNPYYFTELSHVSHANNTKTTID